ncbi:MAG: hypothetical protein ACK5YW_01880 [Betaproteobacteria bacterium]|jgi:hypothetical protein|nr:hypothetical protein [Rhodocyclaceae bacterium]MCA3141979.1 hypothetical protein [Rhodocyclaceae bacterium]MCE2898712.1 hypothetical protein [Betaproteobacteria bacterium]
MGALTRLQHMADASPRAARLQRLQAAADRAAGRHSPLEARHNGATQPSPLSRAPAILFAAMAERPSLAPGAPWHPAQRRADPMQRNGEREEEQSQQGATPAAAATSALAAVNTEVEPTWAVRTVTHPGF